MENINYDELKRRGFLRQKQEGFFVLRTRMSAGIYTKEQLSKLSEISQKFGRGFVHPTTRQGLEVPFIRYEDIDSVEAELRLADIKTGTSGPRLRTTTCCPGNNWCKSGLVNTFSLAERIEKELDIKCGLDLPHKFKIAISGCPNACTRVETSEVGLHGQMQSASPELRYGYAVYLGGCGGRTPRKGFKLENILTEDEVLSLIARVVKFYKEHAAPRQRLALLIEEYGKENFLQKIT